MGREIVGIPVRQPHPAWVLEAMEKGEEESSSSEEETEEEEDVLFGLRHGTGEWEELWPPILPKPAHIHSTHTSPHPGETHSTRPLLSPNISKCVLFASV